MAEPSQQPVERPSPTWPAMQPRAVVWELTVACNMHCRHCGSSRTTRLPDELTELEALFLCDQLAGLGTRVVTLSGGEPLLRPDWYHIARRLTDSGVTVNLLSNGWLIDDAVIDVAEQARLDGIAVSLDGLEATHDFIRCTGSFRRAVNALERLQSRQFFTSVVTTVMRRNLPELRDIKHLVVGLGVGKWQLQIGAPMGNLAEHKEDVIVPEDVLQVLEFAGDVHAGGEIRVLLADCLGYFTKTSVALRQAEFGPHVLWSGCPAGRTGLGIRHNGDVCGCNSVRDPKFIEGNVRLHSLRELWARRGAFAWNRNRTRDSLDGFCRSCQFGARCLAGCSSLRQALNADSGEYTHCAHRLNMLRLFPKIDAMSNVERLEARADKAIELGLLELADRCLERALRFAPERTRLLERAGFVAFGLEDWNRCKELNERALLHDSTNAYALNGLGLALVRLGLPDRGIEILRESVLHSEPDFLDPYHDLAVVLCEQDRFDEAHSLLERARALSPDSKIELDDLYKFVCDKVAVKASVSRH